MRLTRQSLRLQTETSADAKILDTIDNNGGKEMKMAAAGSDKNEECTQGEWIIAVNDKKVGKNSDGAVEVNNNYSVKDIENIDNGIDVNTHKENIKTLDDLIDMDSKNFAVIKDYPGNCHLTPIETHETEEFGVIFKEISSDHVQKEVVLGNEQGDSSEDEWEEVVMEDLANINDVISVHPILRFEMGELAPGMFASDELYEPVKHEVRIDCINPSTDKSKEVKIHDVDYDNMNGDETRVDISEWFTEYCENRVPSQADVIIVDENNVNRSNVNIVTERRVGELGLWAPILGQSVDDPNVEDMMGINDDDIEEPDGKILGCMELEVVAEEIVTCYTLCDTVSSHQMSSTVCSEFFKVKLDTKYMKILNEKMSSPRTFIPLSRATAVMSSGENSENEENKKSSM